jgi:hypothetical protein
MKQFLSQEKLEEIQEIIEMKIVHRYWMIVGKIVRRMIFNTWEYRPQVGKFSIGVEIVYRGEDR